MADRLANMFHRSAALSSADTEHGPLTQSSHGHHSPYSGTGTPEPSLYGASRGTSGMIGTPSRKSLDIVSMRSRAAQLKSNLSQAAGPAASGGGPSSTFNASAAGPQRLAPGVSTVRHSVDRTADFGRKSLGARPTPTPGAEAPGASLPVQVQRQVQAPASTAGGAGGGPDGGAELDEH